MEDRSPALTNNAKRRKPMYTTAEQFKSEVNSAAAVTVGARKKNLLRVTTLMAILLASVSAWAGDHQICYQVPPPYIGSTAIAARFACRTDAPTAQGCQIVSVQANASSPQVVSVSSLSQTATSAESEARFSGSGTYIGTIQFSDGTVRTCTVEIIAGARLTPTQGSQFRTLIGFSTDASGLVMTGVWQATSAPADQAFQDVYVPPDFIAVGGGAEGTESPNGTLVTSSRHAWTALPQVWSTGVHSNGPVGSQLQISPVIAWGIGLKIEGIPISTLSQIMDIQEASSPCCEAHPTKTLDVLASHLYPQTTATAAGYAQPAAISGGVLAQQATSPYGQYVTTSQPLVSRVLYGNGTSEQTIRGWVAASKDHLNPSPWYATSQLTTLPKVLTINGSTFHIETWVSQATSAVLAHPSATVALPGDYALTGVGVFVDWQNSPSAAGNLVWRMKPRPDINGAEAASKDQWFSSPAAITTYAMGMKLVSGPVPPPFIKVFTIHN
jgi:hypothetical protein